MAGVRVLACGAVLVASVVLLAGQGGQHGKGVTFESNDYKLIWATMKSRADVDYVEPKKNKFYMQLDGCLEVPQGVDVCGADKTFHVVAAIDDKDQDILKKATSAATKMHNAVIDGVVQVQVDDVELTRDASTIKELKLEADTIIVKKRVEATLPAVVMEDFKDIGEGVSVRITKLEMSAKRELSMTMSYRGRSGLMSSPFIEQAAVLDPAGTEIGSGRWTEGDPFGKTGIWTCRCKLTGDQIHGSFKFQLATEYEVKKESFSCKEMFTR